MLIPVGTDAPIYHRPITTCGLIGANIVTFVVTDGGAAHSGWLLRFGHFTPTEWVSSAFLHFGFMHLIGNMVFLWSLGLVIEGKLGSLKFLGLYLAICCVDGMTTQLLYLNYSGMSEGAGGASGVIYGLMAIALIWAPKNCLDVVAIIGVWHTQFEVTILTFSLYYIGVDFVMGWILNFVPSTPVLHVLGAASGLPFGILAVKRGWVDCERWDLFSIWKGEHRVSTLEINRQSASNDAYLAPAATTEDSRAARTRNTGTRRQTTKPSLAKIKQRIRREQFETAARMYRKLKQACPMSALDETALTTLIDGLYERQHWHSAAVLLEEYIERFDSRSTQARLMLARLQVERFDQPDRAIKLVASLNETGLRSGERRLLQSIRKRAHQHS